MASRTCTQCGFVTMSQVASACPNCGAPASARPIGPRTASSALPARLGFLVLVTLMLGLGYTAYSRDQAARTRRATADAFPESLVRSSATGPLPETAASAREALRARDPKVRVAGAHRLGQLGDRSVTPLLMKSARDPDAGVRNESLSALAGLYHAGEDGAPDDDPQAAAVARVLVSGLADHVALVRVAAAQGLGTLRAPAAVDPLLRALDDASSNVRVAAAVVLADMREPRAVEPFVRLLKDEDMSWHAAHGLAEIGGARAESVLMDALRRRDFDVMAGAHRFYLRHGTPETEPVLLELLEKSHDLAVAQGFIVEGSPRLAEAARTWAGSQGFSLVKTPSGYSWQTGR